MKIDIKYGIRVTMPPAEAEIVLKHIETLETQNAQLRSLLRDLYRDANPTILYDADTGVRLPPTWNERIKHILEDEK